MKNLAVIPAIYNSSRMPGKPIADICGKPMIWWVYNKCIESKKFDDVIVATDDERIFNKCSAYSMKAMMTSQHMIAQHPVFMRFLQRLILIFTTLSWETNHWFVRIALILSYQKKK